MKCDICGNSNSYVKVHKHNYEIKGKTIIFEKERRFCKECNNLVYDAVLDNEASKEAIKIYNKQIGVEPEKIIELRKKYQLTQQHFSKIIGCAKKTLISYEQGKSIPNDIYLITLKTLIENPETIIPMIESNKERFDDEEYKIINKKLEEFQKNNIKQIFTNERIEPTEYNGFTIFSFDKLKELIKILTKDTILKTKLLKEMFYADFLTYKNTGSSITGLEYAKYPYGPVPDGFENILQELTKENIIDYKIEYKEEYESHFITNKDAIDFTIFTEDELKIIEKVKDFFKNYSSKRVVDFSHEEKAFNETEMFKLIDYSYSFDIERIVID